MSVDLRLPRDAWAAHPHWPEQVLLLGSHRNFRRISERLLTGIGKGVDSDSVKAVFEWWKSAMRGHEHYEEHKLYPYLAHRFGIDPASMEEGHDALAVADRAVRGADSDSALSAALHEHDAVLRAHLDHEESVVVPALLALEPAEFEDYVSHDLRWLRSSHRPA